MNIIDEIYRIIAPEISELKQAVSSLKDEISELKEGLKELRNDYKSLSNELSELKGKYESIEETILLKVQNQFLKTMVHRLENLLDKK